MPDAPSLSEIANIRTDSELGGGESVPIIDNSKVVENLNNAARFHAEQVAQKYDKFLQNKKDLYANIGDIQGLETLPEDKPELQKQMADVLEQIGKDPSVITGGKGFSEVQAKMAKFKSDSMRSKQRFLEDKSNRALFDKTPEMDTPENRKKVKDYIDGGLDAKMPILDTPTIMDERSVFEKTLKDATEPYSQPTVGKDGMHYIESGQEFNPKTFSAQWDLVGGQTDKNNKLLSGAIKYNYDHLPTSEKEKYESDGGGGLKQYWKDRSQLYLDAHLPKGSYEATPQGNYRFGKSNKVDTEYLTEQRLEQQEKHQDETERQGRERISAEWANINLRSRDFNKLHGEDKQDTRTVIGSVVDDFSNAQNVSEPTGEKDAQGNPVMKNMMRITDLPFLKSIGLISKEGRVSGAIDYDPENDQLIVQKYDSDGNVTQSNHISSDLWLNSKIKNFTGEKKDIGGISSAIQDWKQKGNGNLLKSVTWAKDQKDAQQQPAPTETKDKKGKQKVDEYGVPIN